MSQDKPDIMLLVIDSLRSDHLGCYGYERDTSPFLDKLADKGVKLENCYANSYWSVPSHASLFTGDLVSEHKVISNENPELKPENSLINYLNDEGYFTYGNSNNMWVNDLYNYDQAFDKFDFQLWASDLGDRESNKMLKNLHRKDWDSRKQKYLHALKKASKKGPGTVLKLLGFKFQRKYGKRWGLSDYGANKSIRRIKEKSRETSQPFFGFCNFMEAHAAYTPPLGFKRKYSSYYRPKNGIVNAKEKVEGENLQKRINLYDDCIRYIDHQLKEFIQEFEEENPETVFIITSDHGELFFDNSLEHEKPEQGHDTPSCSDEMLKVPFIIYSKKTDLADLFEVNELVSLRETKEIIKSIINRKKFGSKGFIISENIDKDQLSCKIATDGESKAVKTEKETYLYGEKGEEMEEKLAQTETIQKLESITWEKEILDEVKL
jgi:arylsulfatase A-like enzyme